MSVELPEGWAEIALQEVGTWRSGGTPSRRNPAFFGGNIPWIKSGDLPDGPILRTEETITQLGLESSAAKMMPAGTISMALYGATIGKLGLLTFPATTNQACANVFPDSMLVETSYLFHYLLSERKEFIELGQGGAQPNISQEIVRKHPFRLAPLTEQRRIVEKLEVVLTKVNACQQRLEKIPAILRRFRRSVLSSACSGRLTADWRRANPQVGSGSDIVRSLKTPLPQPHLDVFEKSVSDEIPPTWVWVPFGRLGRIVGGGTPTKDRPDFWNGSIPWVSPKDMKRDRIADSEDHISKLALQHSSVKDVPIGSILLVVRGMILNHTLPVAITDSRVTINQDMKALVPEIAQMREYLFLATKYVAPAILFEVKEATHGTRRIESDVLKNWAIPVPPMAEQEEIVRRANSLLERADRIEARYREGHKRMGGLTQSILAKAFHGELVATEAELAEREGRSFESAAQLLERIQLEKSKAGATQQKRKLSRRRASTKRASRSAA